MTTWLTQKEAIKILNISVNTLTTWRRKNKIKHVKVESKYTYGRYVYEKESLIKAAKEKGRYTRPEYKGEHACSHIPIEELSKLGSDDGHGYRMVGCRGHPHASGKWTMYVHRLVMEKYLGRYLDPKETVHHIDGNRSNNDISNLMLYGSRGEHLKEGHALELKFKALISTPKYRQMLEDKLEEMQNLRDAEKRQQETQKQQSVPETLEDCINYIASTA